VAAGCSSSSVKNPAMQAMLVTRTETGEIWRENLFETVLPPLENAPQPDHFVF
jgi:protein-L-isoaspartate(D-aspartate) O-methyltransferase